MKFKYNGRYRAILDGDTRSGFRSFHAERSTGWKISVAGFYMTGQGNPVESQPILAAVKT